MTGHNLNPYLRTFSHIADHPFSRISELESYRLTAMTFVIKIGEADSALLALTM